jgi:hypothetical protein
MSGKFKIIQGEDRVIPLDIVRKTNSNVKRPFDLTGWTKIEVQFRKTNGGVLAIDSIPAHGRQSTAVYEEVTYTASNVGVLGDSISLVFNGIDSIQTVIDAWNTSNPANTVTSDASDTAVVPSASTVNLSGGLDNFAKVTVIGDARDGKIQVRLENDDTNSLKVGAGQGVAVVVDFGDHDLGNRRIASAKNVINVEKPSL